MTGSKRAALVSEVGWKGIRELALSFLKDDFSVDIIIKGSVNREVMEIITTPEGLRIRAIPRVLFKPYLFFYFLWGKATGYLKTVVVTKEQTRNLIERLGFKANMLIETGPGYKII